MSPTATSAPSLSYDNITITIFLSLLLHDLGQLNCNFKSVFYFIYFGQTQGPSMLPTFNLTGDLVLAERLSTRFEKMQRGDVVLVRSPENPRKIVIKRLMGMGGDTVRYAVDHANNGIEHTIVVIKN